MKLTLRQFVHALFSVYVLDSIEYNEKAIVFFRSKEFLQYVIDNEVLLDADIDDIVLREFQNS